MPIINRIKRILMLLTPPVFIHLVNNWKTNPNRYVNVNKDRIKNFSHHFEVLEFSYIDANLPFNNQWGWWSRVYEYELVIRKIEELGAKSNAHVHNTSWGYHGNHVLFKKALEEKYEFVTNSDLLESNIENTDVYDLRLPPPGKWKNQFDFVINVSTVEEIASSHIMVIENLLEMTKTGGHLIVTFDIPGMQLDSLEELFGRSISIVESPVTGINSPYRMDEYADLTVGYFVITKL